MGHSAPIIILRLRRANTLLEQTAFGRSSAASPFDCSEKGIR
jgi:hypothetical protein